MGTKNLLMLKTHFDLLNKCFINEILCPNMLWFVGSLGNFFSNYLCYVFGVMFRYIFRFQAHDVEKEEVCTVLKSFQDSERIGGFIGTEGSGLLSEKNQREEEIESSVFQSTSPEISSVSNTSKYEFTSGREISGFMEEPKAVSFIVKELYVETHNSTVCSYQILDIAVSAEEFSRKFNSDNKAVESFEKVSITEILEEPEQEVLTENVIEDSEEEGTVVSEDINEIRKIKLVADDDFRLFNFNLEEINDELEKQDEVFKKGETFWPEIKFGDNLDTEPKVQLLGEDDTFPSDSESDSVSSCDWSSESNHQVEENFNVDDRITEISFSSDDEYIEIEPQIHNPIPAKLLQDDTEVTDELKPSKSNSDEEEDELGFSSEHEEVIEQLKMELRNARTGGLPTIWEEEAELESPKMVEGLKPLKIEGKCEYKDHMQEIQKVYKAYAEKMRKLDVLNNQTMHAIGFLQLKDSTRSIILGRKSSAQSAKSFITSNLRLLKPQRSITDQNIKHIGDLCRDLELIYVGQVCLSWEFLRWQHRKALELQDVDSQGVAQYNQVASEFQLFQVLLQRFVEDERFKGPRVDNYAKYRCVCRSFLHVPAIKGDNLKDKSVKKGEGEEAIGGRMLAEIIEESMRLFREFLRNDGTKQNHTHLQDPADYHLLINAQAALHKREKRLKDIVRSGNCIVKKLQKQKETRLNYTLFIAQVELRLVSRVLSMSELNKNQLLWCCEKLDQLVIVSRKVYLEPSFLLFPC